MIVYPDMQSVVPWQEFISSDDEDLDEMKELYSRARQFLMSYRWVCRIDGGYAGIVIPPIIGVFLFRLVPARPEVDDWVWVIVGNLPPAYITCEECRNPATAIAGYVGAMEDWVTAVEAGKPVDDLIPVNVPPTKKWARELKGRLDFLDQYILSEYQDQLP